MPLHADHSSHVDTISRYFACLQVGDVDGLVSLFSAEARVHSPFLGWMAPRPFFTKVVEASGQSRIETHDILVSANGSERGSARAAGYFTYHWQLKDGTQVKFDCVDVFDFNADGRIDCMTIVYDTHPVRGEVGDKYA